ncbi:hypothetical protein EJ04DRAFT_50581 [Polyplosphaeria fusca]|uniref:Uncharacterized protein n=1 Tax=Polyplosphaeria fusca TaxID=682080 RepID=A0A9P4QSJ5_9PLEO|nr:hypothetical protein EJ04DRAFT_50581 [Polyplosphaeria fusca]
MARHRSGHVGSLAVNMMGNDCEVGSGAEPPQAMAPHRQRATTGTLAFCPAGGSGRSLPGSCFQSRVQYLRHQPMQPELPWAWSPPPPPSSPPQQQSSGRRPRLHNG